MQKSEQELTKLSPLIKVAAKSPGVIIHLKMIEYYVRTIDLPIQLLDCIAILQDLQTCFGTNSDKLW